MSLGVVGEHTERLFECSPYKHRFFLHIRRQFCVLQTTLHLSCSPYTLKYFLCILYRCLNTTLHIFSEYAERMKNMRKATFTF